MAEGGKISEILLNGSKQQPDERCHYSSLDIIDDVAVCVVDASLNFFKMYCKVGAYDDKSNRIDWGKCDVYDTGEFPSVALVRNESQLYAVEVHCSELRSRLFYRVGTVNKEKKSITWTAKYGIRFNEGEKPKICATDDCIVLVFEGLHNGISYCVGQLAGEGGQAVVNWGEVRTIKDVSGVEPDISVHNNNVVVAFRRSSSHPGSLFPGSSNRKVDTVVGTLKADNTIDWNVKDIKTIDGGFNPSVSINSHDSIVLFYQGSKSSIWHVGGEVKERTVTWKMETKGRFTAGENPTVLLTDGNAITLIHNSSPRLLCHMFQCEGRMENF